MAVKRRSDIFRLLLSGSALASVLLIANPYSHAQSPSVQLFDGYVGDSLFTYLEFLKVVELYHPLSRVADIEVDLGNQAMQMARGGFDPLVFGNYDTKQYSNSLYYEALNAGIQIPTWMGVTFHAGYEDNRGQFLNPQLTTPSAGLLNAGITAQLGSGLLMDERRAAFRIGEIAREQGTVSRSILRNLLYLEATTVYFSWSLHNQSLEVAREALGLATIRYNAVKESFFLGDVPAIDTVEAYTQVLNRLFSLREAQNRWVKSINTVGAFIWDEEGNQLTLSPGIRPERMETAFTPLNDLPLAIAENHPELEKLRLKSSELDVERRLALEYTRPKVELKYNFLTENVLPAPADDLFNESAFFENNYNFGAKVSIPIPMREARGKIGMLRFKNEAVVLELDNKRAKLIADLNAALLRRSNLQDQIGFFEQNVQLLSRVLDGERELFDIGESSLFLINARETNLIQAQNTLFELLARDRILVAEIMVTGGYGFPQ